MATRVQTMTPAGVMKPIGPYSHIAVVDRHISISATAGVDPLTQKLAGPDIRSQTTQIIRSFKTMLQSVNSDLDHIIHVNVFLTDMKNFAAMNEAYDAVLGQHRPARTAVGVSALPKSGALVTMNLTATTKD